LKWQKGTAFTRSALRLSVTILFGGVDGARTRDPVIGGLESTRRIRDANLAVRPFIVALTGWSAEANRKESREAGCDRHLSMPAPIEAINAVLAEASA
jgi:CheY-like chemotaxis protein